MTMQVVKTRKPLFGLLVQSGLGRFADRMAAIVYGWAILQQTGSGFWAGVVIAAHVGVLVIGTLFAGRLIARFGARRVALSGAWLSVLATSVIAILLLHGSPHPLVIAAVSALGACLEGPSNIASETNYPEIARIARWDLLRLNALDDSLDHMAGLVAPAAGASLIVAVGSAYGAVIIAVLCIASALTLTAALPDFKRLPSAKAASLGPVMQYLRSEPVLFPLTVLFSLVMALLASIQFVVLPLSVKLAGMEPTAVATFLAAAAAGSLSGAAAAVTLQSRYPLRSIIAIAFVALAAGSALLALGLEPIVLIASGFISGVPAGVVSPIAATLYQDRPPKALRADVQAISGALIYVAMPVFVVAIGLLADSLDPRSLLVAIAVLLMGVAGLAFVWLPPHHV